MHFCQASRLPKSVPPFSPSVPSTLALESSVKYQHSNSSQDLHIHSLLRTCVFLIPPSSPPWRKNSNPGSTLLLLGAISGRQTQIKIHISPTTTLLYTKQPITEILLSLPSPLVEVDNVDDRGPSNFRTPLHLAIRGNCRLASYIAIEAATLFGKNDALAALIHAGVEMSVRALRLAAPLNHDDCMRLILQHLQGGHICEELLLAEARHALIIAAACWHEKAIVFFLRQVPSLPNLILKIDKDTLTSALLAFVDNEDDCQDRSRQNYAKIGVSFLTVLEQLVRSGTAISYTGYWSVAPFMGLGTMRSLKCLLLEHGLQSEDNFTTHPSVIFDIISDTNADAALLEEASTGEASASARDMNSNTPLHCAVQAAFVEALIKHGAVIHATSAQGCTPLFTTCRDNRLDIAQQ